MHETFGQYRVFEECGEGGMATVHRAEADGPEGTYEVALKRLLPELAEDRHYVRRFIDEARLGQRLKHANIARTYDVGCIDGIHYITFEYIRGHTLLDLLERTMDTTAMPLTVSLHILTQVSRALAYAHALRDDNNNPLNLVHRDIAPSNIIVASTGTTKLIDFGVAKTSFAHVRTSVGSIIGKLGYIAPEYLRGKYDARVDLFSLGVVAYELLTARPLFVTQDLRAAEMLRFQEIEPPSSINLAVPQDLDDIILTALAPNPDHRWQNAFAMYTALSNFAHEHGLDAHDRDVAEWVGIGEHRYPRALTPIPTAEIEIDLDHAFARVRAQTNI
jgi:serine/threonine protein kinase